MLAQCNKLHKASPLRLSKAYRSSPETKLRWVSHQEDILDDLGGEEDEDDDEDETVDAVVHVVERRPLQRHERRRRQDGRQHDEQRHVAGDGPVLDLQRNTVGFESYCLFANKQMFDWLVTY